MDPVGKSSRIDITDLGKRIGKLETRYKEIISGSSSSPSKYHLSQLSNEVNQLFTQVNASINSRNQAAKSTNFFAKFFATTSGKAQPKKIIRLNAINERVKNLRRIIFSQESAPAPQAASSSPQPASSSPQPAPQAASPAYQLESPQIQVMNAQQLFSDELQKLDKIIPNYGKEIQDVVQKEFDSHGAEGVRRILQKNKKQTAKILNVSTSSSEGKIRKANLKALVKIYSSMLRKLERIAPSSAESTRLFVPEPARTQPVVQVEAPQEPVVPANVDLKKGEYVSHVEIKKLVKAALNSQGILSFNALEELYEKAESKKYYLVNTFPSRSKNGIPRRHNIDPTSKLNKLERATSNLKPQLALLEKYKRLQKIDKKNIQNLMQYGEVMEELNQLKQDLENASNLTLSEKSVSFSTAWKQSKDLLKSIETKIEKAILPEIQVLAEPLVSAARSASLNLGLIVHNLIQGKSPLVQKIYIQILKEKGLLNRYQTNNALTDINDKTGVVSLATKLYLPELKNPKLQDLLSKSLFKLDKLIPLQGYEITKLIKQHLETSGVSGVRDFLKDKYHETRNIFLISSKKIESLVHRTRTARSDYIHHQKKHRELAYNAGHDEKSTAKKEMLSAHTLILEKARINLESISKKYDSIIGEVVKFRESSKLYNDMLERLSEKPYVK